MTAIQHRTSGVAVAVVNRQTRRSGAALLVSQLWRRSGGVATSVATFGGPAVAYSQLFDTGVGTFAAAANASSVVRDTTRYSGGALRWAATAGGTASQVGSTGNAYTVAPNTNYRAQFKVSHSAAGFRGFNAGVDVYTSAGGYLASYYSGYTGVATGTNSVTLTKDFTTGATAGIVRFQVLFVDPVAAGELAYLDDAYLFGPL